MNDNITTEVSNEAVNPRFCKGAVSGSAFVLGWFSCGITSAVACKLAIEQYDRVELYYMEIDTAHPDNERFIADCEKWYGQKINRIRSRKYKDQFEVIATSKLTPDLVREIRNIKGKTISEIAAMYNVGWTTINSVICKSSWKHIV